MVAEAVRAGFAARAVLLVVLGCVAAAQPVCAGRAAGDDIWRVAVPVADQAAPSRRAAEREAFARLLVRVTGRESVLGSSSLAAALRSPDRFYSASRYERLAPDARRADPEDRPWRLVIEFDPASVTELLAAERIPIWTSQRPEFVVWILTEQSPAGRRLVGADEPVGEAFLEEAERRGLAVFLPSLDLTDLSTFPIADAWAGFGDAIGRASRRYGSEDFLTLRLFQDALGRWVADWNGDIAGVVTRGALEASGPVAGARAALGAIADALAERFAISVDASGSARRLWLQVDGVRTVEVYAAVLRYLEAQDGILDVQLVQMEDASLLLRLDISDVSERLLDLLRLEGRLRPADTAEDVGGVAVWRARWRGSDR